jgi:hypothetical protein
MLRRLSVVLATALAATALPATAQTPEAAGRDALGTVGRLVLAWQVHAEGLRREDPVLVLTGIRLARSIGQRAATGWGGDALDPPEAPSTPTAAGLPRDPASDAALSLALIMAEGDPDLADLAEEIAGDVAQAAPADLVSSGVATVAAGATDTYQIAFNGQVPAEIAVIGAGTGPLHLRVAGPDDQPLCQRAATSAPAYCGFTPTRNDYFTVTISNPGSAAQVYRLVTN